MAAEMTTTLQQQARALGDPTRHEVFRYITDADRPVDIAEMTEHFGLNHNAIRQQLAFLWRLRHVQRRATRRVLVEAGDDRAHQVGRGRVGRMRRDAESGAGRRVAGGARRRVTPGRGAGLRALARAEAKAFIEMPRLDRGLHQHVGRCQAIADVGDPGGPGRDGLVDRPPDDRGVRRVGSRAHRQHLSGDDQGRFVESHPPAGPAGQEHARAAHVSLRRSA